MRIRNKIGSVFSHADPGDTGAGASGTGTEGPPSGGQSGENNKQNNLNPFANPATNTPETQTPPPSPTGAPDPSQTGQPQTATMQDHIKGLNMTQGIDMRQIADDLGGEEPNYDSLMTAFDTIASNVYQHALLSTNKLMDARINAAVQDAVKQATGRVNTDSAMRALHAALPLTKEAHIEPVAKATLSGFLKQGQDVDTAISNTVQYFQQTTQALAKYFQTGAGNSGRVNTGFQTGPGQQPQQGQSNQGSEAEPDWLALLGGQQAAP